MIFQVLLALKGKIVVFSKSICDQCVFFTLSSGGPSYLHALQVVNGTDYKYAVNGNAVCYWCTSILKTMFTFKQLPIS